jgi:HSP20 family protein
MLVHWTPFTDFARLQTQLDRLFDPAASRTGGDKTVEEVFRPSVDVVEDAEKISISVDLPGVAQSELELRIDKNVLTLKGARKLERLATENEHYRRYERSAGAFERSFRLPPTVNAEKIEAAMKDGVLTLTLPKKPEAQPRQIKINA